MDLMTMDQQYIAHTYNRFPLQIIGGSGSTLYCADGKEYIDLGSGIGVNIFGINDEAWKCVVTEQLNKFQHCSNLYYSKPSALLAQMLCHRADMSKVFFSNSGAEANECAIKAARKWAAQNKGKEYVHIITLKQSFHGRTLAALAATGQDVYHKDYQPLPAGFLHTEVGNVAQLEALLKEYPCAAIMFEAVQGEGGVMPIGQAYADALSSLSREYNVLLIADEVQLGNGRSGQLYGYMNYAMKPDIVSTAKGLGGGLPLGATLLNEELAEVFSFGDHGTTFGGNPICCAGAVNILSRIDEPLLQGVRNRSSYIYNELSNAKGILSVSGMGLMLGLEIEKPSRQFAQELLHRGVLVTTAKQKLRLLPALNIPMEQLKQAVQTIKDCAAQ
ncbi:MAG: aminotransferase class III-fold pyridoxal phosphate-dependent enzyme [Ruminococcaceae bacterium]|nr:aminotransferase class III-fold pyridoxal phosphate-dependent enzyme [Oscillospiraceae bacterium]